MREAHVSAEHPQAQEAPRLPGPYAHTRRPGDPLGSTPAGSPPPLGLIWRVRDRATFVALSRARRHRRGGLSVRYVPGGGDRPPRVAYALGRDLGRAVARNRVRRRLRAAMASLEGELLPGAAYLVGAGGEALTMPFEDLTATLRALVGRAQEGR